MLGSAFTMEAFCNNESATTCRSKCLQDSFLQLPVHGNHILMHPSPGMARRAILHYLNQKKADPGHTSAVIILPAEGGQYKEWTPLIKGMELLKQYSGRDRIFRRNPDGEIYAYGGATDVWYDPPVEPEPDPEIHQHFVYATSMSHLPDMIFATHTGKLPATALVDTGAKANFVELHLVKQTGIFIKPAPGQRAKGAGDQSLRIYGTVNLPLRVGMHSTIIEAFVVDTLIEGVDLILGDPWQNHNRVVIDKGERRIKIRTPGKHTTIVYPLNGHHSESSGNARAFLHRQHNPEPVVVSAISAKTGWKALKKGADYMMIHVREQHHLHPRQRIHNDIPSTQSYSPYISVRPGNPSTATPGGRYDSVATPGDCDETQPQHYRTHRRAGRSGMRSESYAIANLCPITGSKRERMPTETLPPSNDGKVDKHTGKDTGLGQPSTTPDSDYPAQGLIPQRQLDALLEKYKSVFPPELPSGLPPDRNIGHVIRLEPDAQPPYRRNRRMSPTELSTCEEYIKDLLAKGFITPSTSPFGAPVMFIAKPAGGYRVVCDWRALNNLTIKNRYPLPRIDETLDRLGGAKIFSSLDLNSGYFQIRISEEDAHKTAFTTPHGQYEFKVLGQGLANSPATFQSVMNRIFANQLHKFVVVYLDDIMIYSNTPEEHAEHIETVLKILQDNKFYAKREKCSFNLPEVKFLGHIVGRNGLKVDPKKVEVVKDWPTPKDVTQVRQFLGLTNYFRKFIQDYSALASPLMDLTKKGIEFRTSWTPVHDEAFLQLKAALTSAPVLILPDFKKPFELISDASLLGTGAVLLQEGRVIAYTSKKLTPAEKNYTTTEQEMLGIVNALGEWRCYFGDSTLTLVTDHEPLKYFNKKEVLSRRLARWAEFMAQFDYKWEYRNGRNNVADPISRNPTLACFSFCGVTITQLPTRQKKPPAPLLAPEPQVIMEPQTQASESLELLQQIRNAYRNDPTFKNMQLTSQYVMEDGVYLHQGRMVIPANADLRKHIISEAHDPPHAGHGGRKKTLNLLTRSFYWPNMIKDVDTYVATCRKCQSIKPTNTKQGGLLQPTEIPGAFWECISMDYITQLPPTKQGNDAIMVFVDKLSKMTHFAACKTAISAEETATLFRKTVFKYHGIPAKIISDRDARFTGHFMRALCQDLGIRQALSTAFHPESDGQTERMNRVLEDALRNYVNPHQNDWDEYLDMVEFAINNSWQTSIEDTPFHMIYGQHPHTPLSRAISGKVPAAQRWMQSNADRTAHAIHCIKAAQDRQKAYADTKRRTVTYAPAELVWLSTKNIRFKAGGTPKFSPRYIGPFKIIDVIGPTDPVTHLPTVVTACKLALPPKFKIHPVFHVSLLKHYKPDGKPIEHPPMEFDTEGLPVFEAAALVNEKTTKEHGQVITWFLVRWKNYSPDHDTWEKEEDILGPDLIEEWRSSGRTGPKPRPRTKLTSAGKQPRSQQALPNPPTGRTRTRLRLPREKAAGTQPT